MKLLATFAAIGTLLFGPALSGQQVIIDPESVSIRFEGQRQLTASPVVNLKFAPFQQGSFYIQTSAPWLSFGGVTNGKGCTCDGWRITVRADRSKLPTTGTVMGTLTVIAEGYPRKSLQVSVELLPLPPTGTVPTITTIVGAADFQRVPFIAGSLFTIFGRDLADKSEAASRVPWPTRLANTEVLLCESPPVGSSAQPKCAAMGLLFVSAGQINFRLSVTSIDSAGRYLVVSRSGIMSTRFGMSFSDTYPQIFHSLQECPITTPQCPAASKFQRLAITHPNGSLVLSANPTRADGVYVMWLIGLSFPAAIPGDNLQPHAKLDLRLYPEARSTSGASAEIIYVGHSAQFPGLFQINFRLPKLLMDNWPNLTEKFEIYFALVTNFASTGGAFPFSR